MGPLLQDLLAEGHISAQREGTLLQDASAVGATACSNQLVESKDPKHIRASIVFNFLLKESGWNGRCICHSHITCLNKEGENVKKKVAFMPPHEVLFMLVERGDLEVIQDSSAIQGISLDKLKSIKKVLACPGLIPLAAWSDSTPVSWDRHESIEAYTWSLPGQSSKQYSRLRFPLIVLPHKQCSRQTHMEIMSIMKWSLKALAVGRWPVVGPFGEELVGRQRRSMSGRDLGFRAALIQFKGDWKYFNEVVGLPRWKSKSGVCWRCKVSLWECYCLLTSLASQPITYHRATACSRISRFSGSKAIPTPHLLPM